MMRFFSWVSFFVVVSFSVVSCGGGGSSTTATSTTTTGDLPPTRPGASISGSAFDGLIINGTVSVYDWSAGKKGALLGSAKTDKNGLYALDIVSRDEPILVVVSGGYYTEEASGKQIQLKDKNNDYLTAVQYYVSGKPVTVSATFFSSVAHGLAEYLVSQGETPINAIIQANRVMSDWAGFDIVKTTPLDVTDLMNASPVLTDELKYGFVSAAISEFTKQIHDKAIPPQPPHTKWPSISFIRYAYNDVKADGKLDGRGGSGTVGYAGQMVTANTYRELLGERLLQFVESNGSYNKTGLGFDDLRGFASRISKYKGTIFGGSVAPDITAIPPVVKITDLSDGDVVSNSKRINFSASDTFGIKNVQWYLDGALVESSSAGNKLPPLDINIRTIAEGSHSVTVEVTNLMGVTIAVNRSFTVSTTAPSISNFVPSAGAIISGSYRAHATIADLYGVDSVLYYVDGAPVGSSSSLTDAAFNIDTLSLSNGDHVLKVLVTNVLGKTASISRPLTVANGVSSLSLPSGHVYVESSSTGYHYVFPVSLSNGVRTTVTYNGVPLVSNFVGDKIFSFDTNSLFFAQWGSLPHIGCAHLSFVLADALGGQRSYDLYISTSANGFTNIDYNFTADRCQ